MSQAAHIIEYLRTGAELSPLQALDKFGIFRLGARIWDLKRDGHDIISEIREVGNGKRVAFYRLGEPRLAI